MGNTSSWIDLENPFSIEILIPNIEGWALCKCIENAHVVIYGEHMEKCIHNFDPENPGWGWVYFDVDPEQPDRCWQCGAEVPKEIVGLVAMMNWESVQSQ